MKDDLTNRITGSITTDGAFPLVVKVDISAIYPDAMLTFINSQ